MKVAGTFIYGYDANGNMTSGSGRVINYDFENRPTSITKGGVTTSFVYDGDGGRVQKTDGTTTTVYIGQLYVCDNSACTKMIFAGGSRVAQKTVAGGVTSYYHADHLGSTSAVTTSAGVKEEDLAYYPYGDEFIDSGAQDVKFKYTGQEKDDSTGLYFYQARYYDPFLARFISADTIVPDPLNPQALNRYSYVLNNPILYTDPSGHGFFSSIGNFFKGIGKKVVGAFQGDPQAWLQIGIIAVSYYVGGTVYDSILTNTNRWTLWQIGIGKLGANAIGGIAAGATAGLTAAVGFKAAGYDVNIGKFVGLGALSGGLSGGIGAQNYPWAGDIALRGLVGGGVSELAGGDFGDGFTFAASISALNHFYKTYRAPGDKDRFGIEPGNLSPEELKEFKNFFFNGSPAMRFLNNLPFAPQIANIHDPLIKFFEDRGFNFHAVNVPMMGPALAIGLGAETHRLNLEGTALINIQNRENEEENK